MVVATTAIAAVTTVAVLTGGTAVAAGAGATGAAGGTAVATLAGEAATAGTAFLIGAGPIGWIALDGLTWDCWRDILHDYESSDTRGRLLKDIASDGRVVEVRATEKEGFWPQLWFKNQWNETFRVDYVQLSDGDIAAHATRV